MKKYLLNLLLHQFISSIAFDPLKYTYLNIMLSTTYVIWLPNLSTRISDMPEIALPCNNSLLEVICYVYLFTLHDRKGTYKLR